MASISTSANGLRRIDFTNADGIRKTIRLGRVTKKDAETILGKVEAINAAKISRTSIDNDTAQWLSELPDKLYGRLTAAGLATARIKSEPQRTELAAFIDAYIGSRSDVKGDTAIVYGHTRRCLIGFFGAKRSITDITPGEADEWRRNLARPKKDGGEGLAENTVRRRCGIAKQFFRAAIRKRLIKDNPFGDMKGLSVKGNKVREFFITTETSSRILDACPDQDWRVIFALSRWGGLRCPSEHLGLRWRDIDWQRNRMTVTSPKTAHHDDKETREVPLFPELRRELEAARLLSGDEAEFIITRYRDPSQNMRTTFEKIIRRAGSTPWPKLFQNLRASRATELAEEYPGHVAAAWLGHSEIVANRHYRQVTEDHFSRATESSGRLATNEKAPQKAPQSAAVFGSLGKTRADTEKSVASNNPCFPGKNEPSPNESQNWEEIEWAVRDSNPRHPRCKRGALTN